MRFGLKEKLLAVGVGIILTSGIIATATINLNNTSNAPADESEEGNMETTSIDLSPIESAVSEGVGKINSATEEALEKIQSAIETPDTVSETISEVPMTEDTLLKTGVERIPLNIVSDGELVTLTFTEITISHDNNYIYLLAEAAPKISDGHIRLEKGAYIIDQNGNKTISSTYGSFRQPTFMNVNTQELKSISLTYQVTHTSEDGTETSDTVTIDIPLETTE